MDQAKKKEVKKDQVIVKGQWVQKDSFRSWIYSEDGQKLVNSHAEYEKALATGLWFDERPVVSPKVRKQKDDHADG